MNIINGLENWKPVKNPVVTVGSFDGVHAAHKLIIELLNRDARACQGESVLVTFSPHPRTVLVSDDSYKSRFRLLTTDHEKANLLRKAGLNNLLWIHFDEAFSKMPYGEFIEKVLVQTVQAHKVVMGFNHNFGHDREGGYEQMLEYSRRFGFSLDRFPEQMVEDQHVSSTRIRNLLMESKMEQANHLLGYMYQVRGHMAGGTMIPDTPYKLLPGEGNYLVRVKAGSRFNYTVCNIRDAVRFPDLSVLEEGSIVEVEFVKELNL